MRFKGSGFGLRVTASGARALRFVDLGHLFGDLGFKLAATAIPQVPAKATENGLGFRV